MSEHNKQLCYYAHSTAKRKYNTTCILKLKKMFIYVYLVITKYFMFYDKTLSWNGIKSLIELLSIQLYLTNV